MGKLIMFVLALLLISQAIVALPGSVLAAIIVPGNLVEGALTPSTNLGNINS